MLLLLLLLLGIRSAPRARLVVFSLPDWCADLHVCARNADQIWIESNQTKSNQQFANRSSISVSPLLARYKCAPLIALLANYCWRARQLRAPPWTSQCRPARVVNAESRQSVRQITVTKAEPPESANNRTAPEGCSPGEQQTLRSAIYLSGRLACSA